LVAGRGDTLLRDVARNELLAVVGWRYLRGSVVDRVQVCPGRSVTLEVGRIKVAASSASSTSASAVAAISKAILDSPTIGVTLSLNLLLLRLHLRLKHSLGD